MVVFTPFRPGSILFPLQDYAEQQASRIYRDPIQKASFMLNLVERRITDLNDRTGSQHEYIALKYLDEAIDQASTSISLIPTGQAEQVRNRLSSLAELANKTLNNLKLIPIENNSLFVAFQSKIKAIIQKGNISELSSNVNNLVALVTPKYQEGAILPVIYPSSVGGLIPFPPGSQGALHSFYPLIGQHGTLTCDTCHNAGKYIDTPKECIQCHLLQLPNPHYPGACEFCHTPVSWTDIQFDHTIAAAMDCAACHEKDKPAEHYNGQCSACHVTQAWNLITFDHTVAGAVDCISCHAKVEPANHYPGQCSNCHNTSDWKSVVFSHVGLTDCISCHSKDTPANHYAGQCSNCHDPNSSWQNAYFNHSGFTDCTSCHAGNAPANHYPGQCSNCHDPNSTWQNVHFNHSGYTDCISCHIGSAPGNHYPGQCSNCHNTSSWSGAVFNHSGFTDCISCHLKDRPADHDSGQCSNCHNTQHWGDGGGDGVIGFLTNGILQPFSCTACHATNYAFVLSGNKQ